MRSPVDWISRNSAARALEQQDLIRREVRANRSTVYHVNAKLLQEKAQVRRAEAKERPIISPFDLPDELVPVSEAVAPVAVGLTLGAMGIFLWAIFQGRTAAPVLTGMCSLVQQLRARKTALRPKELAVMLSVSERQITAMVKAGRMPGIKIGGAVRIDPGDAADWLEDRKR